MQTVRQTVIQKSGAQSMVFDRLSHIHTKALTTRSTSAP